jgi:hypothetical protein
MWFHNRFEQISYVEKMIVNYNYIEKILYVEKK